MNDNSQRIDKFLWFARFFKTRPLAASVVGSGRVRINGNRTNKPGATIAFGDVLTFPQGDSIRVVRVKALAARRGSAEVAHNLYDDLAPAPVENTIAAISDVAPSIVRGPRPEKRERAEARSLKRRHTG